MASRSRHAHAEGGRFARRSLAGRLFWLCVPLALLLLGMLVFDASSTSRVLRDGVHASHRGRPRRQGAHDDKKALLVSMPALFATSPSTARITEYLSAEQWEQAVPGQDVRVVYRDVAAASRNEVFVEADLQRFQRQRASRSRCRWCWCRLRFAVLVFWPRYRIGRHDDGQGVHCRRRPRGVGRQGHAGEPPDHQHRLVLWRVLH